MTAPALVTVPARTADVTSAFMLRTMKTESNACGRQKPPRDKVPGFIPTANRDSFAKRTLENSNTNPPNLLTPHADEVDVAGGTPVPS